MFTGLIQATGTLKPLGNDRFQVSCTAGNTDLVLQDLELGDSVAVDGVCLTVTEILSQGFVAVASLETLRRTTLGQRSEATVNLEASLRAGSKLGGHFVTGHVDGVGCLAASLPVAHAWEMRFTASPTTAAGWERHIAPYLVPKGSIAVNGISLTVADCDPEGHWFQVAVIPHTFSETNLSALKPGNLVNLEADILGKYVAKFLRVRPHLGLESTSWDAVSAMSHVEEITPEFLAEHGFL